MRLRPFSVINLASRVGQYYYYDYANNLKLFIADWNSIQWNFTHTLHFIEIIKKGLTRVNHDTTKIKCPL